MRAAQATALALLIVIAGCGGIGDPTRFLSDREPLTAPCDEELSPPENDGLPDPEMDVIGWEAGRWYNESIAVTASDGLSCAELEGVLARTMARVEHIRQLEFETTPTLTVIARDTYREQVSGGDDGVAEDHRAFANVKYEALLMVNESADAIAVERRNRGASVAGFYSPSKDTIVLITDDSSGAGVHEGVLAHELVHALQDQHFPPVEFPGVEDTGAAHRAITEGDANYVEHRYERRCGGPWLGTCLLPDGRDEKSSSGSGLANLGLYVISYQPYSDGPPFIQHVHERGGWAAVNDLYRNPPASTEQTIHPRLYPEEVPTRVELRDRSTDRWNRLTPKGQPNYETWGERGLFAMFLYPAFESEGETVVVRRESFLTPNGSALDPYNYTSDASAGWAGDRLLAYQDGDGDLAYVWKLAFDRPADAREFLDAYRAMLQFRGAHRVAAQPHVWRIPEGQPFADAFYVRRTGDTVLIVNAPTVDELDEVRRGLGGAGD